jgi:hypothetical protein
MLALARQARKSLPLSIPEQWNFSCGAKTSGD